MEKQLGYACLFCTWRVIPGPAGPTAELGPLETVL